MSLCGWEQRSLRRIEAALRRSDPRLTSLLTIFNRLGRGEKIPGREQLPAGRNRLGAVFLLSLAVAGLLALLLGGLGNGGGVCLPHPVLSFSSLGPAVSFTCSEAGGWPQQHSPTRAS